MYKVSKRWKPNNLPKFSKLIQEYRIKKQISQNELEDCCGIPYNAISYYECGRTIPDFKRLKKIYMALDIPKKALAEHINESKMPEIASFIKEKVLEINKNNKLIEDSIQKSKQDIIELFNEMDKLFKMRVVSNKQVTYSAGVYPSYFSDFRNHIDSASFRWVSSISKRLNKASKFISIYIRELAK
jgi:transcriptional regulator with XRE-family HTH domain